MALKAVPNFSSNIEVKIGGVDKKTGKPNPTSVKGYYLSTSVNPNGKYGVSKSHFLQTPRGVELIWGKKNMDKQIEQYAKPGMMIEINYTGMRDTPKGAMHTFELKVDEDDTIDVVLPRTNSAQADTANGGTDEEDNYENDDAEEETSDDTGYSAPSRQPAVAAAASRTSLQEVMNRRKK